VGRRGTCPLSQEATDRRLAMGIEAAVIAEGLNGNCGVGHARRFNDTIFKLKILIDLFRI